MKYQQLTEGYDTRLPASVTMACHRPAFINSSGFIHRLSVVSFVVIVLGRPISRSRLTNLPRHDG